MIDPKPYRHRFPMTIIQHAIWLYHRFPLSYPRCSLNRPKTPVKGLNAVPVSLKGDPGRSVIPRTG